MRSLCVVITGTHQDPVAAYAYTIEDRRQQLGRLIEALSALIPVISQTPEYSGWTPGYQDALEMAKTLLRDGFTQEDLSALRRAVPKPIYCHKEWLPPLERQPDGRWIEPDWYVRLEEKMLPVIDAAEVLRILGYY